MTTIINSTLSVYSYRSRFLTTLSTSKRWLVASNLHQSGYSQSGRPVTSGPITREREQLFEDIQQQQSERRHRSLYSDFERNGNFDACPTSSHAGRGAPTTGTSVTLFRAARRLSTEPLRDSSIAVSAYADVPFLCTTWTAPKTADCIFDRALDEQQASCSTSSRRITCKEEAVEVDWG